MRIIICGFDYSATELIVEYLVKRCNRKNAFFSSAYEWSDNMRADDVVCHFIADKADEKPGRAAFIPRGHADLMFTQDLSHGVGCIDRLRHRAYVIAAKHEKVTGGDVRATEEQLAEYIDKSGLRLRFMDILVTRQ